MLSLKVLLLLLSVNGIPPLLAQFFPKIADGPLDNNHMFFDGYPVLGTHKTIRGFLGGILTGGILGYLLGFSFILAMTAGLLGMLGDSFTSFIKRRLHIIGWGGAKIFRTAVSPRRRDSLRSVRSSSRFREWRACHTALSPFARVLNFENVIYYRWFMKGVFKCMGIYNQGVKNALDVQVKSMNIAFPALPHAFNGYRILFISDLHIDGLDGLDERLKDLVSELEADLCLLGGDYRMEMYGRTVKATRKLRDLVKHINACDGILGVLGNHDCLEAAPDLEDSGIYMLINDSFTLKRNGEALCIIGTDDPHYYKCNDLEKAFEDIPAGAFSILLSHSPEIIKDT